MERNRSEKYIHGEKWIGKYIHGEKWIGKVYSWREMDKKSILYIHKVK